MPMERKGGPGGSAAPGAARPDLRELRLPLDPAAFPDLERGAREYWSLVKSLARRSSAVVSESPGAATPSFRELVFFDTPPGDLRRCGHLLSTRARIVRGAPTAGFELAHAFRDPDPGRAATADVLAAPQYEGRDMLREELMLTRDGGERRSYARVCTLREHRWEIGPRIRDASRIFPGLGDLPLLPTAALRPVGEAPVEELHVSLGEIDFGSAGGRVVLSIWRDAWSGGTLSVDLTIETPAARHQRASAGERLRREAFERQLVEESGERMAPLRSRAEVVYARVQGRAGAAE